MTVSGGGLSSPLLLPNRNVCLGVSIVCIPLLGVGTVKACDEDGIVAIITITVMTATTMTAVKVLDDDEDIDIDCKGALVD